MVGENVGNETVIHPLGLVTVLLLSVAVILLPRRYSLVPFVILVCFIPSSQRLVIGGADFTLLRILVLFGWMRLLVRNEFAGFRWNRVDSMMVGWMVSGTVIFILQYATTASLLNRTGWMFDGLGMYFLFRCVLRNWEDLNRVVISLVVVSLPVAAFVFLEWSTGRNLFSIFGGVSEFTPMREGRLRCRGAFSNAILAGTFWAAVLPFMVSCWVHGYRWLIMAGIGAAFFSIFASASSTPLLSVGFVLIGLAFWFLRQNMQVVRWGFFGTLVVLHFAMAQPVWHLLARVNVVGGSTGWHRYRIMDATINNFSEWWLLGADGQTAMSWAWEMRDITNQYILEALRGGLLTLVFFIALLSVAFGMAGRAMKHPGLSTERRFLVWCIGVGLFVHVAAFFAVSYFGQIIMLVYLNLAMLGSLPTVLRNEAIAEQQAQAQQVSTAPLVWGRS